MQPAPALSKTSQADWVTSSMGRTMHTTLDSTINALSICRDTSQVAVAGRNLFKIFSIEDEGFEERHNLRVGRVNLNYSSADVVWHPSDDNLLATAATNGAVITWNLAKSTRSKQDHIFTDHKRTVNKVCFHPSEPNILLSGSIDGSMKLFDLRKKEVSNTFTGKSESVRDVQFSPHQYFCFAAAFENGNMQLWDIRRTDKYYQMFTAHNGPVFSIDWHTEERNWIASAGRDKTIKIWTELHIKPSLQNTVQTIASVARIKWRPQRRYHIASSSLLVDQSINIWDIRRPYIPFATFEEHKDVATGIVWRNDPHVFLSCSKDCTLYQHVFRDAKRPAETANPVGVAMNIYGDVCHAASDTLGGNSIHRGASPANYPSTRMPAFFRKNPEPEEQTKAVCSTVNIFKNQDSKFSEGFCKSAQKYLLTGKPFADLCEHNAQVAQDLQRHQVAQSWKMLKLLYAGTTSTSSSFSRNVSIASDKQDKDEKGRSETHIPNPDAHFPAKNEPRIDSTQLGDSTGVTSENEESESDLERDRDLTTLASGLAQSHGDFFFGDGEVDPFDYDNYSGTEPGDDWTLPTEAFQPRHEIVDRAPSPSDLQERPASPSSINESDTLSISNHILSVTTSDVNPVSTSATVSTSLPQWEFTPIVKDMLHFYAEQGDVQMTVSALIILGDRIRSQISETSQEVWFMSYIELLCRFQLYTVATEVIKLSNHAAVGALNQASTTIHTNCNKCNKPLTKSGWLCERCCNLTNTCSICHHVVKGLYVWCQGCNHGGHLHHIEEWLKISPWCPVGCGHLCEYS
ncbi:GATOR2 complex protein WDR24-like isoform X2 [Ptychodera flava]|uniref:GATOR2 complex protein WDR24-like isoform X2 n=1 Tax=Ptychodera flava TaxID=63121 RepID=UPI00396A890F